jgi:hypothetical protein
MKFLVASVALILLPLSAAAQKPIVGTQWNAAGLPPVEYDKPFFGKYTEVRVGAAVMAKVCPKTPFPVTLGCAVSNLMRDSEERITVPASECVVYIADDDILEKAGWSYDILMRHERAHCLGWPASHPGQRMANVKKEEPGILPSFEVPERGQWPSDLAKARWTR